MVPLSALERAQGELKSAYVLIGDLHQRLAAERGDIAELQNMHDADVGIITELVAKKNELMDRLKTSALHLQWAKRLMTGAAKLKLEQIIKEERK
jgi:hypothetical protein